MISELRLKFGTQPDKPALSFDPSTMTVFVGPNSSGKSLLIKELTTRLTKDCKLTSYKMLDCLTVTNVLELLTFDQDRIMSHVIVPQSGYNEAHINASTQVQNHLAERTKQLLDQLNKGDPSAYWVATALHTLSLDGSSRLKLSEPQDIGDLLKEPRNFLGALLKYPERRRDAKEAIFEAIQRHMVLDPTLGGKIRIRLSIEKPPTDFLEISFTESAFRFYRGAEAIEEASDGIKAFVGILAAAYSGDYRFLLIDEPEAFLHPPLARSLGQKLTERAQELKGHVFAATHSSDFLMGCLLAKSPLNIIRLTYDRGIATARHITPEKVNKLMRNPMLRSAGVLSGLFYKCVIVTEADSDRVFYQEVNTRLIESGDVGSQDVLFLNAHSINSVPDIVSALRQLGIPAAAVVDFDLITDEQKKTFGDLLVAAAVPQFISESLKTLKNRISQIYQQRNLKPKREGVSAKLTADERAVAFHLLEQLGQYGIFLPQCGELENWMPSLGVQPSTNLHGPGWVQRAFTKMGEDPGSSDYARPTNGDVWDFMRGVAKWFENPTPKGIPG